MVQKNGSVSANDTEIAVESEGNTGQGTKGDKVDDGVGYNDEKTEATMEFVFDRIIDHLDTEQGTLYKVQCYGYDASDAT